MMVLWGHVSPQLLRKVMELLHQDLQLHGEGHLDVDHIKKLAKLGHWGQYPNNVWTELKKILPTPKLPRLHFVWLPFKHLTLGKITRQVPLLLPHQVFGAIYQHYPAIWQQIVYGSQAKCKEFWSAVRPSPQFQSHKVSERPDYETKCIPLKIHGDGTPVTGLGKGWSKMVDIFSVSSLLICGPTVLRNLMMFLMWQHLLCRDEGHCTMDEAYKMFIWSFYWMWLGKKPTHDWAGKEMVYAGAGDALCGGYFFTVWALICDLEHAHERYDLPNPTALACCPLCPVGLFAGLCWWDFRPSAGWLAHVYNVQSWLARGLLVLGKQVFSWGWGGMSVSLIINIYIYRKSYTVFTKTYSS